MAARVNPVPRPYEMTTAAASIAAASAMPSPVTIARRRRDRKPPQRGPQRRRELRHRPCSRGAELPVPQRQHPVGDRRRLHLVGDEHDRASRQAAQDLENRRSVLLIERSGRLICQHELWIVDEGARDREALLFTAGELVRQMVGDSGEAERVDELVRSPGAAARRAGKPGGQQNVLDPAQLLDQLKLLEDEADVAQTDPRERAAAAVGQTLAGDRHLAGVRRVKPTQHVKQVSISRCRSVRGSRRPRRAPQRA